ncbi:MAG: hypothetical protein IAE82_18970 [Opitutaceae bacterium]|nr:hypothetical protein [Opitutaceae bacterium]
MTRMAEAQMRADDATTFSTAEPPVARRRLRGPIQQSIDLFFVDRRGTSRDLDNPVYDPQGQPKRRPARPGAMLNLIA